MRKTALVTGAGKGIGRAIALNLAQAGYDVAINYSTSREGAEEVAAMARDSGARACAYQADVKQVGQIAGMFEAVERDFGRLDLLVNNAGITKFASVLTATEETWETVINTDLKGTFFCAQAAARLMVKRQTQGVIVNISSNHAKGCWPDAAIYAAAKAGVNKLTENLAMDLACHGIRVVGVAPGYTILEWRKNWQDHPAAQAIMGRIPAKRFATTDEIAKAVVFLAGENAGYITGATLSIDGGALLPVLPENTCMPLTDKRSE